MEIPVIDAHSHFADKSRYFEDESHFNEQGHRAAALLIFESIVPLLGVAMTSG